MLGAPDLFRGCINQILPSAFDRLGDAKAPVREAGRDLFIALMSSGVVSPLELVGKESPAWRHKNWRVREETLRVIERAFAELDREIESGEVNLTVKSVVNVAVNALEDREPAVREAAICAVVGMNPASNGDMARLLQKHSIRPGQMKEISARLEGDESNGFGGSTQRVSSPVIGASRAAAETGRRPSTSNSTSSGGRDVGLLRRASSSSSTNSGGSSSLHRTGSLGANQTSSAVRAHVTSLLTRPNTVAGGERPAQRTLSGGVPLADPNDVPPYGRATGIVNRIAEGAPPRPCHVDSDRELSNEIDRVAEKLDPKHEWTDRINAMVRVEALLLGGAAEWDSFPSQLVKLRKPLTNQVADRRSAIVRQAAHLLVILAAELGGEFEKDAVHFVPELFKCSVITVQIIAESGDYGIRGILHNCQAKHLVPKLCETASKDRSVKLRGQATGWLRVVVKEWDGIGGSRNQECLEEAIGGMVGDGSPDVRAGARRLFSAYRDKYPDGAERVFHRFDGNTKRLIAQESASGAHDDDELERAASALLARRPHTAAIKTRDRTNADRPSTVGQVSGGRARGNFEKGPSTLRRSDSIPDHDMHHQIRPATTSLTERANRVGSVGGMATTAARAAAAAARRAEAIGGVSGVSRTTGADRGDRSLSRTTSRVRVEDTSDSSLRRTQSRERPQSREQTSRDTLSTREKETFSRARSPSPPKRPLTVNAALDACLGLGTRGSLLSSSRRQTPTASWEQKTAAFDQLAAALRVGGSRCATDASSRARDLADAFTQHVGDPHHRVAHAVLEAIVEAIPATGTSLEPELERLCPPLFPRLVDAKENVRGLASAALAAVGDAHPADAILPALLASLDASKAPRAKTGVLEFALYVLSGQGGGTDPAAASRALKPASAGSRYLREWVSRVAPLVSDRHAPLRAAAAAGLAAVHARADPVAVLNHLSSMSTLDAAATCRSVGQHAPSIEQEFHAYTAAERRAAERAAADAGRVADAYDATSYDDQSESEDRRFSDPDASPSESSIDEDAIDAAADQEELRAREEEQIRAREEERRQRELELVEKARRVREEQRREEAEAVREREEQCLEQEERNREEECRVEQEDGFSGASDVSDDDVEIVEPESVSASDSEERLREDEANQRATATKAASVKLLETESAAVRAYRESRAAADASVERLAAARATLAAATEPKHTKEVPVETKTTTTTTSPVLAEALLSVRASETSSTARARALASVRRVLRSGVVVTSSDANAIVTAATEALTSSRGSLSPKPESTAECKTHALFTLRDLARSSPVVFAPFASIALPTILDALEDPEGSERDPEIALGAGDALDGVVDSIAPEAALKALAPRLTRGGVASSAAPVRCVGGVIARMSPSELEKVAPDILPSLCEAFNSTSADVRKAVVDALVAMYDSLGDWLLPKLTSLTAAQQKLLTIYINRAAERREKGGNGLGKNAVIGGRVPLAPRPAQ